MGPLGSGMLTSNRTKGKVIHEKHQHHSASRPSILAPIRIRTPKNYQEKMQSAQTAVV
jgi:hypothetical protein